MKHRLAMWALAGFLVAACWVLYTFLAPTEEVLEALHQPAVQLLAYTTCPVTYAGRHFPIHYGWVLLINAATYALIGFVSETIRHKAHQSLTT